MKRLKKVSRTPDGIISSILERLDHVSNEVKPDYERSKACSAAIRDLVSFSRLQFDVLKYTGSKAKSKDDETKPLRGLEYLG